VAVISMINRASSSMSGIRSTPVPLSTSVWVAVPSVPRVRRERRAAGVPPRRGRGCPRSTCGRLQQSEAVDLRKIACRLHGELGLVHRQGGGHGRGSDEVELFRAADRRTRTLKCCTRSPAAGVRFAPLPGTQGAPLQSDGCGHALSSAARRSREQDGDRAGTFGSLMSLLAQ